MLDILFLAMFVVVVVLGWSVYQVKYRRRYRLHKWVQLSLGVVLLLAVVAFETDMRLYGWEERAAGAVGGHVSGGVWAALYVHLVFATRGGGAVAGGDCDGVAEISPCRHGRRDKPTRISLGAGWLRSTWCWWR